jgi:hypothetical protein
MYYTLGEHDKDILIDTPTENREAVISLARQARSSINLFTRDLDPRLFDNAGFEQSIFTLARSHHSADVRILTLDSGRARQQGHCLIRLAQKLTSSVFIHNPAREYSHVISTFLVVDRKGVLHRPRSTSTDYDAVVNYMAPERAAELQDFFNEMWERSTPDSQIRRLFI